MRRSRGLRCRGNLRSRRGGWRRSKLFRNGRHGSRALSDGASAFGVALQALQVGANISGALVAEIAIFLQRLVDDVFELGRKICVEADRSYWGPIQNGIENQGGSVATE